MVKITENLIRKRAEHNECEISTLEEVSLHQQDIERIEHLDKWCRELKILYLQSNLIPRIENISRLKKLQYLNLALNNIEKVENLEGCESLTKLDFTVNFIGELSSIECLKESYNLKELFLTGNPCTEYEGYREYVIATLPQLKHLDGVEIEKSIRICAIQNYDEIRPKILLQQEEHKKKREDQKEEARIKDETSKETKPGFDGRWYTDMNKEKSFPSETTKSESKENDKERQKQEDKEIEEKDKKFWEESVAFTPESRIATHDHMKKMRERDEKKDEGPQKKPRQYFTSDGRALNVNEPKIDFTLTDDEENNALVVEVACYKFMDISLIDCDVQPHYVRVTMKGKIFQLCLTEEVNTDSSTAKRSQITGHLLITMPKAKQMLKSHKPKQPEKQDDKNENMKNTEIRSKIEKLEVDKNARTTVDIGNIVQEKTVIPPLGFHHHRTIRSERLNSEDFVDDMDVPPLE